MSRLMGGPAQQQAGLELCGQEAEGRRGARKGQIRWPVGPGDWAWALEAGLLGAGSDLMILFPLSQYYQDNFWLPFDSKL